MVDEKSDVEPAESEQAPEDTADQSDAVVEAAPEEAAVEEVPDETGEEVEIVALSDEDVDKEDAEEEEEDSESEEDEEPVDSEGQFFEAEDFSEAYDLEHGELIRHDSNDPLSGLPSKNIVETAKEFFSTEILYRFDILEDQDREKIKGSYVIELNGENGGTWSLDISEDLEISNEKKDADVVLNMRQKDFVLMVNGELNPQLSILSGKFKVKGNYDKAINIQTLLSPHSD